MSLFSSDLYNVNDKTFQGKSFKFSSLKGKVALVVNIASRCGYTPQLDGLQKLYSKYQTKNFTIIGVPSNDFGGQSPEGNSEFKKFCEMNYGVSFLITEKINVKGKDQHPLYTWLTKKEENQNLKDEL